MKKKYYIIIISLVLAIAILIAFVMRNNEISKEDFVIETAAAKIGMIVNTVTATGTLEAIETVEVGTQVSGVIEEILVDFNSIVKKGQVLAKIDETPLIAQVNQSQANVDQAEAEFTFQSANYERNRKLYEKQLISQADFDQIIYNYNIAKANLANAKANHDRNRINLQYATIKSPIDGVVLERAVDEGQTVAASFNTPTLFTIANDLTQMKVEASVDEADIGQVKSGQRVEFTVDAFPDLTFTGTVIEVRLQPVVTNNVVTYTVIIDAPNPENKLMPGMTATSTIFVLEAANQLLIPMQALDFEPDMDILSAYMISLRSERDRNGKIPTKITPDSSTGSVGERGSPARAEISPVGISTPEYERKKVWLLKNDSLYTVPVKVFIDDGINCSISDGLKEGNEVVLSLTGKSASVGRGSGSIRSPFMPGPPDRNRARD